MSDLERAERHRRDQLTIRAGTLRAFRQAFGILTLGDLRRTLEPWLEVSETIIRAGHDRSAEASSRYYGEARAASIARRLVAERDRFAAQGPRFEAQPVDLDSERVRRSLTATAVGTATKARRSGLVDLDDRAEVAATRAAGRLAMAGGRETLESAIENDPESVGWCRITDGSPCGFCAMLASRGFVYLERSTALFKEGGGDPYHDGCGCTTMPRFRDDPSPLPAANQRAQELWYQTGAYFTGEDALNGFRRAVDAQNAGRDPIIAAFRGADPSSLKTRAQVEELRRIAQRGGTNGLPPDDPRRAA